ncbi:ninein-like protein [Neosynchiropus ocellatus]
MSNEWVRCLLSQRLFRGWDWTQGTPTRALQCASLPASPRGVEDAEVIANHKRASERPSPGLRHPLQASVTPTGLCLEITPCSSQNTGLSVEDDTQLCRRNAINTQTGSSGGRSYVSQLKAEFDRCDSTSSGLLNRQDLTVLCQNLQLEAGQRLLLDTLLGEHVCTGVDFPKFKNVLVSVLSGSSDASTSEDDSSYLDPVVPQREVKPKWVRGSKSYGRRSCPDDGVDPLTSVDLMRDSTRSADVPRAEVRRSPSLDSVQSLKSEEDAGRWGDLSPDFLSEGAPPEAALSALNTRGATLQELQQEAGPHSCTLSFTRPDNASQQGATLSLQESQDVLSCSGPCCCSTPARQQQKGRPRPQAVSAPPSLLMATVGHKVLSQLDDGSGFTTADRVIAVWNEEGIQSGPDILQTLDFSLDELLSLTDLTMALDNELLVSGNGIHQAALISYKSELQHLQVQLDQAVRQKDKVRLDLEAAESRILRLVREVDDRQANLEAVNQSRLRELQQNFRERLSSQRLQAEQESDALLQQLDTERRHLREEVAQLKVREGDLQEELCSAGQEKCHLQEDLSAMKQRLTDSETLYGGLDPGGAVLTHEEPFSEIVREYELQCRELRDRNDELSSELDLMRSQRSLGRTLAAEGVSVHGGPQRECDGERCSGTRRLRESGSGSACAQLEAVWGPDDSGTEPACGARVTPSHARVVSTPWLFPFSDEPEMKRSCSPVTQKTLEDKHVSSVSLQTELALEQLQQKHQQEVKDLQAQLETQVNYYERSLALMRQNVEVERKDVAQAFKLEITELEEQKAEAEKRAAQLKEALDALQVQLQHGGRSWSPEQERRVQRERADMEQNFAREISNLVQQLSSEKEHLEAELKLKMDQEVMLVRTQLEEVRSDNSALQERLTLLQQQLLALEDDTATKRTRLQELQQESAMKKRHEETLLKENSAYREEVMSLSSRNLQLSNQNTDLSSRLREEQQAALVSQERLAVAFKEQQEGGAEVQSLRESLLQNESELKSQREAWTQQRRHLEEELGSCKRQVQHLCDVEAELLRATLRTAQLEEAVASLTHQVESLQSSVVQAKTKEEALEERLRAATLSRSQGVLELRREEQEEAALASAALSVAQQEDLDLREQERHKMSAEVQRRLEDLEVQLHGAQLVLQEKVGQLKEQLLKNGQNCGRLRDLSVENSQLMVALQVTEQRQKDTEKKNVLLEEKVHALNQLLKDLVTTALAT